MNEIVDKLMGVERHAAAEKGDFALFAAFVREDAGEKWDLVVSAPWLEENRKEGFHYLVGQVASRLTSDELFTLSRVVVVDEDNPGVKALHETVQTKHARVEMVDCVLFGMKMKRAYIITSSRLAQEAPQP